MEEFVNEEEVSILTLTDENGEDVDFEYMDSIEYEGKEYLVFAGTTSIGNNGKNTIVLFKDKLVGSHHCDIVLEGSKYVLVDCGTPMGTIVNGRRTSRHILRQGDAIAIGNRLIMMNHGRIIYDISGEEKKKLTVSALMELFAQASEGEFANDRMLLG